MGSSAMDEPWELAKLPSSVGIPFAPTAHKNDDRVTVTCPKRVDVYALPESKCVESWSLDRNSNVSSSGEQNKATGNYYVAHEGGVVYQWDETASCHSDWMRHDVHDEVMAIHTFEDVDDALLITESGAAEWMTSKKEQAPPRPKKKIRRAKSSQVAYRWSGVWLSKFSRKRAVVVYQDHQSNELKVSLLAVSQGESPHVMSSRPLVVPPGATFRGGCLLRGCNAQLVVLFSNGQVVRLDMDTTDEELSMSNDSLISSFECKCDTSSCSLVAVDDSHVALVGVQEIVSGEMAAAASLWNVAFSTRLAVQKLTNASTVQRFGAVMLPGSLVVLLDHRLVVVPCRPPKNSVSAIGACGAVAAAAAATAPQAASPVVSLGEWTDRDGAAARDTPPPERDASRHQILQQCLDDKKAWSRDTVERVVRSGQVSGAIVPRLVERLTALQDYQLLAACLKFVPDASELTLVTALAAYVQCLGRTKASKVQHRQVQGYLDAALTVTFNPTQLRDELRRLAIGTALKLIELLHTRIAGSYALSDECKTGATAAAADDVRRLMTWMTLVLDAQATKLLLDSEAKQVLVTVNTSLRQQLKVSFQLQRLFGALDGIKRKSTVHSAKKSFGNYRIEVLNI